MKTWYLLYCKARGESRAQANLANQDIETYLPTIPKPVKKAGQTILRRVPLFPSYLFVYFDPENTRISQIRSTRGVVRIVGSQEKITVVADGIINALRIKEQKLLDEQQALQGADTDCKGQPFQHGDKVKFIDGPFIDLEGIFVEKNGDKRCQILFEMMGREQKVNASMNNIHIID